MQIGDAESNVWLEGARGRSYSCQVSSRLVQQSEFKRLYDWSVEIWEENEGDPRQVGLTYKGVGTTFDQALRHSMRKADQLEELEREKRKSSRRRRK